MKTLNEGVKVLDQLGVLERLFLKLANNPDKAATKLTVALAELAAGYTALHNEMLFLGRSQSPTRTSKNSGRG
jgi:hypothetical protein